MSSPFARLARDLRTARHIPPSQLAHRLRFLVLRRLYAATPALPLRTARGRSREATARRALPAVDERLLGDRDEAIARAEDAGRGRFTHLASTREYGAAVDWRDATVSPLWAYQMQYLGAVVDFARAGDTGGAAAHLASWRSEFGDGWDAAAWHPYPVSLRVVNVCIAASLLGSFSALGDDTVQLVAAHARYLERHLERDVRGNHLLENAVALAVVDAFIDGAVDGPAALRLVRDVLPEQVLPDGMHYELSPMYHVIVLQRVRLLRGVVKHGPTLDVLAAIDDRMTKRLAQLCCPDGGIPLLGDSARGFALEPSVLLEGYATGDQARAPRGVVDHALDAGIHVLRDGMMWCAIDTGPVCPPALPAHGQADALTIEVWVGDTCLVTDPGLHEYTGQERAWGRSSRAHSTITIDDRDSSEVYDSFRVGGRDAVVYSPECAGSADHRVRASLRPWGIDAELRREVAINGLQLTIHDEARSPQGSVVRSRLHLHPDVDVVSGEQTDVLRLRAGEHRVSIRASGPLHIEAGRCSRRFGEIRETSIVVLFHERDDDGWERGWMSIELENPA